MTKECIILCDQPEEEEDVPYKKLDEDVVEPDVKNNVKCEENIQELPEKESIEIYSEWENIPDILLEKIFSYLTIKERYYASQVCYNWYKAFHLQNVWSTFVIEDTTLTRGKFNYYSGWQYVLDHMRTSACLNKVGKNFRSLVFEPMLNFYNLYEFMNMVSWYAERQGADNRSVAGVGTHIRHLKFTFPCNMAGRDSPETARLFGTGGKLLEALKRLMGNLKSLKCLELIDLMLDSKEALHLMDEICDTCTQTLTTLVLINTTKQMCSLIHVGVFLNLNTLIISPQNLDDDVIELLGYTNVKHFHIFQNRFSPKDVSIHLPKRSSWMKLKKNNPFVKVHFEIESSKSTDILLPFDLSEYSEIPCQSIVLNNPLMQIPSNKVLHHMMNFHNTLKVYAIKGLTRYYLDKAFPKRIDEAIIKLCKACPNLHTLMIRDKISTATILEIVSSAKSLRCLYIRRNSVLKKCDNDLLSITDWSPEHKQWIKENSNDYLRTEAEVSKIFGYRWHLLTESEFASQSVRLHI